MSRDTWGSLSVHMGPDALIRCSSYPDSGPILAIDGGEVRLSLHQVRHKVVDACDVDNARALVKAATIYLAECERLYAQDNSQAGDAAA